MNRVLVIALDGATMDLVRPWTAAGELPVLGELMEGGVSGELESTLPPVTSPAWPSFATGKNPGKHGVFDFIASTPSEVGLVNAASIDGRTLWGILSDCGARVGVVGVPVTYPPSQVNGFMITGLLSPTGADISYPPGFLTRTEARYEREIGQYRIAAGTQCKSGKEKAFLRDIRDMITRRGEYALRLMRDEAWDFFMIHFLGTDVAQHALWRFMDGSHPAYDEDGARLHGDAIRSIYGMVDEIAGRLVASVDNDVTVMIMSDHGFGPLHGVVNLNNLFLQGELMHLRRDLTTRIKHALFTRGLTPSKIYRWLELLGLQDVSRKVSKSARNRMVGRFLSFDDVDWSHTRAYSMGHVGQVYVNLKGREPCGIVEPGSEYEEVREEVIEAVGTLCHPVDGKLLVDSVVRREEIYSGAHANEGPDLQLMMDDYRYISYPLFATNGEIITSQTRGDSGCHRLHGVLIARGPQVLSGQTVREARIIDLAPTILYLMGLPVPDDMDGQVLASILDPGSLRANPVVYQAVHEDLLQSDYEMSSGEEQEIKDRLRGLGYL